MQNPSVSNTTAPVVSVFGSSSPAPGDPDYTAGVQLGRALAELGLAVQSGGYMGLMEAVSQGASEAGGHVIGVTSRAIEDFRPARANAFVAEEIKTDTLAERLIYLTKHCQIAVVLPGGVGTMTELSLVWNQVMVGELERKPIIAIGDPWRAIVEAISDPRYTRPEFRDMVTWVADVASAVAHLATLSPAVADA